MGFCYPNFRKPKAIIPATFASTTAGTPSFLTSTTYGENFPITFQCLVGNVHISTLSTAPSTTVGLKLTSGDVVDLMCQSYLALVSDTTTASYQAIVWER